MLQVNRDISNGENNNFKDVQKNTARKAGASMGEWTDLRVGKDSSDAAMVNPKRAREKDEIYQLNNEST